MDKGQDGRGGGGIMEKRKQGEQKEGGEGEEGTIDYREQDGEEETGRRRGHRVEKKK